MNIGLMEHLIQPGKLYLLTYYVHVDEYGGVVGVINNVEALHKCLEVIHANKFSYCESVESMVDRIEFTVTEVEVNQPTPEFYYF